MRHPRHERITTGRAWSLALAVETTAAWTTGSAIGQTVAGQPGPFAPTAMPKHTAIPLEIGAMPVSIDYTLLAEVQAGETIGLPVDQERELSGRVDRIERRTAGRYSIFGRIEGDPDSYFIVAVDNGALAGVIDAPYLGELHQFLFLAEGVGQIAPIDRASYAECALRPDAGVGTRTPHSAPPATDDNTGENSDDGDEPDLRGACIAPRRNFDVLIVYTTAAKNAAGGAAAIRATAQLAVDTANQVYSDSQINPRATLLFTEETSYVESTDIADDRDRLTDPDDGVMDSVHGDRDDLGADFVCLFVAAADTSGACGIAHCTPSGADQGFCVVRQACAVGNFSFAHEIGHLQGCAHDIANAGVGCNEYCYSYGWRFFGDSGTGWRTVMAYDNTAGDYTRIGRFSNPNVFWDGQPTGNDNDPCVINENNTRTINNTAADCEGWRPPRFNVWVESGAALPWRGTFQYPYPTIQLGYAAIFDGSQSPLVQPTLHIKAGSYVETLTFDKPMTIRSCGGSAVIGM